MMKSHPHMKTVRDKFLGVVLGLFVLPGLHAGATTFYVDVNSSNPTLPYADLTTAAVTIQDAVNAATNGDLILVNDGYYQDGFGVAKETVGTGLQLKTLYVTNRVVANKPLTIQSLNGPSAAFISGSGIYRCAYLTNGATLSGFTLMNGEAGWISTTKTFRGSVSTTNILDGGGVSGAYTFGAKSAWVSNCVLTANQAYGNGGGAYWVNLVNCTVSGNAATSGGGAYESALVNCLVTGNSAQTYLNPPNPNFPTFSSVQSAAGGGLYVCYAVNCIIANNTAYLGGGVYDTTGLENCTIVNNSATFAGGVFLNGLSVSPYSYASNCIIYYNTASTGANFGATNLFGNDCCTFPLPAGGTGNLTNDPALVDVYGGDLHLQAGSPCINSGNNAAITNSTDLDGNPRIVGGTVDIGAYEFPTPASVLSYAWAQQYGLPTDGSADYLDSDGDGMNNWQEFIAGTNPTNATSLLAVNSAVPQRSLNWIIVKWQSVNTRTYYLQRSSDLAAGFSPIQSNIVGQAGTTIFYDTTATNSSQYFYRVGVQ